MSASALDWFDGAGPLAASLRAREPDAPFEPRPQQARMAEAVERAMARRGRLLVEAGTGVGKSFAYLAPAVQRIIEHGERVVVATHTIALQEQLLKKDIPVLQDAAATIGASFRAVLVKGRGNYVSLRRLALASSRQDALFADAASRRSLHTIEDWASETADGTLSTLPVLERAAVWEHAQSDSGNCMGRKCPTFDKCFYQQARRAMDGANLLICNHALFFSDLALRAAGVGFLPKYDHVILDEAHQVEDVASEHFGRSLSEGRVRRLLVTLDDARRRKGFLRVLAMRMPDPGPVESALDACHAAMEAAHEFFERLVVVAGGLVGERVLLPPDDPAAVAIDNDITPAFRGLALRLRALRDNAPSDEDRFELNAYAERASDIADVADILCDRRLPGCAYWIEVSGGAAFADEEPAARARPLRAAISCSPIEVGPLLRETLYSDDRSVILTSATLTTPKPGRDPDDAGHSFDHALSRLGLADESLDARTLALGSPFDHAAQSVLIVDRSVPDPRAPGAVDRLAERIVEHVLATRGGAFVLFTSFDTLRRALAIARPALEREGLPVLAQERDGPRGALLDAFRADENSVLFGAASFWQGIDVRGRGLRNVIITRLPFDPPDRPLTRARLEAIEARGGNPFMDETLPRAVLRFKQAFGRLIRSSSDDGQVVVLDPRIATKPYGRAFLAAIPQGVEVRRVG